MIPKIAEEKLAEYIDVFCETVIFQLKKPNANHESWFEIWLDSKIHVNQFNAIGGVGLV
jgi:imidazolonepropionase